MVSSLLSIIDEEPGAEEPGAVSGLQSRLGFVRIQNGVRLISVRHHLARAVNNYPESYANMQPARRAETRT
jgi:hypothetical protein